MKVAYIVGCMRGIKDFNFPAFHKAAAFLRSRGWKVYNPAEMDGLDIPDPITDKFLCGVMARDCYFVTKADTIALLPGWEKSTFGAIEVHLAVELNKKFINAETEETLTNVCWYSKLLLDKKVVLPPG